MLVKLHSPATCSGIWTSTREACFRFTPRVFLPGGISQYVSNGDPRKHLTQTRRLWRKQRTVTVSVVARTSHGEHDESATSLTYVFSMGSCQYIRYLDSDQLGYLKMSIAFNKRCSASDIRLVSEFFRSPRGHTADGKLKLNGASRSLLLALVHNRFIPTPAPPLSYLCSLTMPPSIHSINLQKECLHTESNRESRHVDYENFREY